MLEVSLWCVLKDALFSQLGQKGFFDRFNVSFHHQAKLFQIEVPEPPQPPPKLALTQP
jgi:hypothetical protein